MVQDVARITTDWEYELLKNHINKLIEEATQKGYLAKMGADNEFTREIARLGKIGALYETEVLLLPKRIANPLVLGYRKRNKRPQLVST